MKKIFALILCLMLLCAMPLAAFAEEVTEDTTVTEEETTTEEEVAPPEEVPEETPTETPETPEETPTEDEEPEWEEVKTTVSDAIVNWIIPHIEEISVVITLILACFYNMRKHKLLNRSMGTLNNNAITVAEKSANFMGNALSEMQNASGAVTGFETKIVALLEAFKTTAEDKARLEAELVEIKNYLKTATDANVELGNEIAELLGLANIPNYKKEEMGARHLAVLKAIIEAEKKAEAAAMVANTGEVKEDAGETKNN